MNSRPVLTLDDVTLTFPDGAGEITAVDRASLSLDAGELIAITGPSGSGKSSLLAVASTLQPPTSGSIRLGDRELAGLSSREAAAVRRNDIGIVFQQPNLIGSLTATEQLMMTRHLESPWRRRASKAATRGRALELLERLGLADARDRNVGALSGGQRQRVNIARALMNSPALLVVDEPTSALDSGRSADVMDLLLELVTEEKVGTLLVTHDEEAARRADRRCTMVDGKLTEDRRALVGG
ncbi:ABC transporter ATP-binding protein [Corynebacterium sp. P5875]|uniref:ABC transporter ATP-binding protein n=1 Tax=Corynebacterium antarcticum TaxID=2800405 RepID=A0A9Q4GM01_9CORY|nr:ABC transporter ATP-binding protein [Corynebacterium antarcticum]MCX7537281.1 ABC transporter ATP-binding protein [Corynebacterium antarcticum]